VHRNGNGTGNGNGNGLGLGTDTEHQLSLAAVPTRIPYLGSRISKPPSTGAAGAE
jgi:hypothetical protein